MFVAFDLEATGLSMTEDRIVEVGAVRFDELGAIVATFEQLVKADRPSAPGARALHGIDDEQLDRAGPATAVLPEFVAFLGEPGEVTLLAHNAAFDAGLLGSELIRSGLLLPQLSVVDTLAWARRCWPELPSHKLTALARTVGVPDAEHHRALADSDLVRRVVLALRAHEPRAGGRPPLAYPIYDPCLGAPIPRGWEAVAAAIRTSTTIEIIYEAGSRGPTPRTITPVRFEHRGGTAYLVATCHLDNKLKRFRPECVVQFRTIAPVGGHPATPVSHP